MYRIGIDLGGTNIKVGILDEEYKIIFQKSLPTGSERAAEEVIADMGNLALELMKENNIELSEIISLGIGSPGLINAKTGVVEYSNNLGWNQVPIVELMKKIVPVPVYVSNDANCAALGEVKGGAAKNYQNVMLLTLGTGVGSGIIIEGKIFEGAHTGGSEYGHTTLIYDGVECTCGRKGCLEAYTSATALIRETKEYALKYPDSKIHEICEGDFKNINGKTAFLAAKMGDEAGQKIVDQYISHLGAGIVNAVNIFRPDVVLISGGVCNEREYLTNPLNEYVKKYSYGSALAYVPEVIVAELGNNAGITGAAALD